MPSETTEYLIIGAGPTGLGAAYRLRELGVSEFRIVDSASHVGGLASSFVDDAGFTWDIGGHVQFSHYRYFDDAMDRALGPDGWIDHERESWVWMRDRFLPYPFQYNIGRLPKEEVWECIEGLLEIEAAAAHRPRHFGEWIRAKFGRGIARVFMEPYNWKVWAHPLEELSADWIGERVAVTNLKRVLKNVLLGLDDISWGPNHTFRFPRKGGSGSVWEAVGDLVGRHRIQLNCALVAVRDHQAVLANGETVAFQKMLNTTPLDGFSRIVEGLSQQAVDAAASLKHSTSHIIGIGLRGGRPEALAKKCWMYFPEDDCPFYRVTVFSNYSPANAPEGCWSLMAEVSESQHRPVNEDTLFDDVVAGLRATKLITGDAEVVSRWRYRAGHGYPIPSVDRDAHLGAVHAALELIGISSRGRFGGWKYEVSNQDHSFMQGVEWANRVVLGEREMTYPFPEAANANRGRT